MALTPHLRCFSTVEWLTCGFSVGTVIGKHRKATPRFATVPRGLPPGCIPVAARSNEGASSCLCLATTTRASVSTLQYTTHFCRALQVVALAARERRSPPSCAAEDPGPASTAEEEILKKDLPGCNCRCLASPLTQAAMTA
jgi:hypothetical protein